MVLAAMKLSCSQFTDFVQTMARGYSEEADRILNHLVSDYMHLDGL
jgi:hypothetical protein